MHRGEAEGSLPAVVLQAKLEGYQQQLSDMHADLQQVRSKAAGISSKLKPLRQHLVKAAALKDKATAALEQAQVSPCCAAATTIFYSLSLPWL